MHAYYQGIRIPVDTFRPTGEPSLYELGSYNYKGQRVSLDRNRIIIII